MDTDDPNTIVMDFIECYRDFGGVSGAGNCMATCNAKTTSLCVSTTPIFQFYKSILFDEWLMGEDDMKLSV